MSVCIYIAFVIQNAMRMRDFVICGMPRSTHFFSTLGHKGKDFQKKNLLDIKYVF